MVGCQITGRREGETGRTQRNNTNKTTYLKTPWENRYYEKHKGKRENGENKQNETKHKEKELETKLQIQKTGKEQPTYAQKKAKTVEQDIYLKI